MKKYSYPYLFSVTILFLAFIFGGFMWHREVYRMTFLNRSTVRYMLMTVFIVALVTSCYVIKRGTIKSNKYVDYIRLFCAANISLLLVAILVLVTIAYCLPGEASSYTTNYTYAASSRSSCAGAEVNDVDLGSNIRICYPAGKVEFNNQIYVEKRSNAVGMVVTYAQTFP